MDSPGEESYVRFSVSGVTGAVQSATLRFFVGNGSSDGPSLYNTDSSWSETGITWNNRPAPAGGVIADVGTITVNTWAEYDLTGQVTGDGTYDFVLLPDSSNGVRFDSREASSPPELVLTFGGGPTNQAPDVTITGPTTTTFTQGDTVDFAATATDAEDGDLTASLVWASDLDGAIGSGGSFTTDGLPAGVHTITAEVTDSGGAVGSDITTITVTATANQAPVVTITGPTMVRRSLKATLSASPAPPPIPKTVMLTASLVWASSLDGAIGSGGSFTTNGLSARGS